MRESIFFNLEVNCHIKKLKTRIEQFLRCQEMMPSLITQVDLRQFLLTDQIIQAIKKYNPDLDISMYKQSKLDPGFPLPRMERMMEADFNDLLDREPVEVIQARSSAGKPLGTKIDGVMKPLYEIQNGRHRIARAILEGKQTVPILIL